MLVANTKGNPNSLDLKVNPGSGTIVVKAVATASADKA